MLPPIDVRAPIIKTSAAVRVVRASQPFADGAAGFAR